MADAIAEDLEASRMQKPLARREAIRITLRDKMASGIQCGDQQISSAELLRFMEKERYDARGELKQRPEPLPARGPSK